MSPIGKPPALLKDSPAIKALLAGPGETPAEELLEWCATRFVNVHGESDCVDFVRALRRRAASLRALRAEMAAEQEPPAAEAPPITHWLIAARPAINGVYDFSHRVASPESEADGRMRMRRLSEALTDASSFRLIGYYRAPGDTGRWCHALKTVTMADVLAAGT